MGHHFLCGPDRSHTAFVGVCHSQPALFGLVVDNDGDFVEHHTAQSVEELVAKMATSHPIPFNIQQMLDAEFNTLHGQRLAA